MAKLRIYELAREYKVSNEELVKILQKAGFSIRSHMSNATDKMVAALEKKYTQKKTPASSRAAAKQPAKDNKKPKEKVVIKGVKAAKTKPSKAVKTPPLKSAGSTTAREKPGVRRVAAKKTAAAAGADDTKLSPKAGAPTKAGIKRPPVSRKREAPHPKRAKREPAKKAKISAVEMQQKAVRESVRRTLAKLEVTRKTRRRKEKPKVEEPALEKPLRLAEQVLVKELADAFEIDSAEMVQKCIDLGIPATVNQKLEREIIELLAEDLDKRIEFESEYGDTIIKTEEIIDASRLKPKAPVVTVMGHVDHGKTSILDYIRKTNVALGEAGGITQHIGACEIATRGGKITFIDTPGHEAFTAMRARGASVTDIVVLVVAADDGVMPQTIEAINHARAANVHLVVAINKIDLVGASPDNVKQQLAEKNVVVEEFAGDVLCQEVSAKTGEGVDKLLDTILLQAELLELKALEEGPASGVLIEVKKEEGRGILCTLLIKQGTIKVGDAFVAGVQYGKVRALLDHSGKSLKDAKPAMPILVLGCNGLPNTGEDFIVVRDEREAREISLRRQELKRIRGLRSAKKMTLEELYSQIQQGDLKELKLVVKCDTNGSVEALNDNLAKLSTDDVKVSVIHYGVGFITESDVLLAASSEALIIGFNVKASPKAEELAQKERVEIRSYTIIYECLQEMKDAIEGMLEPEIVEKVLGRAEVRKIFRISKLGVIAGSMVLEGTITRNALVRVLRHEEEAFKGKITSLKRFQEDVKDVQKDFECGIGIAGYNDVQEGDILETYIIEQKSKIAL